MTIFFIFIFISILSPFLLITNQNLVKSVLGLVLVYLVSLLFLNLELNWESFHWYLLGVLFYICFLSNKHTHENKLYLNILAFFLIYCLFFVPTNLVLFFLSCYFIVVTSFFLYFEALISWYLGLDSQLKVKPSLFSSNLTSLGDRLLYMYYHPKYVQLLNFWNVTFPERIKKGGNHIFGESVILVILSFYTILNTRYVFILVAYLVRCVLFKSLTGLLVYFIPLCGLTILVYYPPFVVYIKSLYGETVFKQLDWNTGTSKLFFGTKTVVGVSVSSAVGCSVDDFISVKWLNPMEAKQNWINYHTELNRWLDAGGENSNLPNKPTPPDNSAVYAKRIRHNFPGFDTWDKWSKAPWIKK